MEKRKVACYQVLAHVAPGVYNYPVYCMIYEGWSNFSLTTCINCGELFVIDWENPLTNSLTVQQVASLNKCPTCDSLLKETIRSYPSSIKLPNNQIGTFTPGNRIPSDNETLIMDFFEILPPDKT